MTRINHRLLQRTTVGLMAMVVFALGSYVGVQAYSGKVFGREESHGYFKNKDVGGSSSSSGYVLKSGIKNIDSVKEMIDYLKSKNNGGDQDETGSAFIVYTLLGKNGSDRDKDISNDNWKELTARLNSLNAKGGIKWSQNVTLSINSYYQKDYKDSKGKTVKPKDDAFYSHSSNEKSIVFRDKGKVIYALAHKCANPMGNKGDFGGLPEANQWDISVKSELTQSSNTPGQTIKWKHTIENKGPDETDRDVDYYYQDHDGLGGGHGSDWTLSSGDNKDDEESSHLITQDDVGKNLCRSTKADPKSWDDDGTIESSSACVFIPYNYTLTPHIVHNITSGVVEANTPFTVTPSVTSTGPTKSKNTQWQITQIIVQPSKPVPNAAGGTSVGAPCGTYFLALPDASCSTIKTGNTVFNEAGGWLSGDILAANPVTAGDYAVGTKICFAFSLQPHSSSDDQWVHTAPICLVVGKKPKVQIWGNDLSVGGLIKTSTSVKNIVGTRTFGSWVEYGIFATSSITGMASGSAYAGPGLLNATVCNSSTLSFTNAGSSTCGSAGSIIGGYVNSRPTPDVAASLQVTDPTRSLGNNVSVDLSAGNLQGIYSATGTVSITGGGAGKFVNKGQWIVINAPTADVTINGDINYTSETLTTINDIPQVVIIAKNIYIADSVTNIDAWLISSGKINTCSTVAEVAPLDSNTCNQQLTVNGPVITNKLFLRRTAGSGTGANSGDPAEVFNLRPDAYLWAAARATSNGRVQTVYTTELPPRF